MVYMAEKDRPTPRVFDRRVQFDERSRAFPIRALLPDKKPRSYSWRLAVQLDQGREGACVGFGWAHEAAARPVCVKDVTNDVALSIYRRAQELDDFPETPPGEGTSVLAGAKVMQERGLVPEYRWSFSLNDLCLAVGYHGPAVLGLEWREGMMNADAKGFIHSAGDVVGGHCIVCIGVNVKGRYFTLQNSWGSGWGLNGRCRISWDDLDERLHKQGEACVPVRRALGPQTPLAMA